MPSSTTTITPISNKTAAIALAKTSKYYAVMQNYSALYANAAQNCTGALYNSSFLNYYNTGPSGASSYAKIINNSPSGIALNITNSGSLFYFTYNSVSSNPHISGKILTLNVNVSSGSISNFTFSGIFIGNNYTQIYNNYLKIIGVGGSCSIYIV